MGFPPQRAGSRRPLLNEDWVQSRNPPIPRLPTFGAELRSPLQFSQESLPPHSSPTWRRQGQAWGATASTPTPSAPVSGIPRPGFVHPSALGVLEPGLGNRVTGGQGRGGVGAGGLWKAEAPTGPRGCWRRRLAAIPAALPSQGGRPLGCGGRRLSGAAPCSCSTPPAASALRPARTWPAPPGTPSERDSVVTVGGPPSPLAPSPAHPSRILRSCDHGPLAVVESTPQPTTKSPGGRGAMVWDADPRIRGCSAPQLLAWGGLGRLQALS